MCASNIPRISPLCATLSGAAALSHDLWVHVVRHGVADEAEQFRVARASTLVLGALAIVLGILFEKMNVSFLVGWAFSVAASANLPALVMLLFWRGTTKQGIIAAVLIGMFASLAWILASGDTYRDVYGRDPATALVPFSQPGIVTIPLGFIVLVVVSLLTRRKNALPE